jgi:outer membrane murein-binding lipoprotein Lpp
MEAYYVTLIALMVGIIYVTGSTMNTFVDALVARVEELTQQVKRLEAKLENGSEPTKDSDQQQPTDQT